MSHPLLITIPISHYGERARWALDRARLPYVERHHLQMFSWVAAWWHGGSKTLPVLLTGAGPLTDSGGIVRRAEDRSPGCLYPDAPADRAEIEALEARLAGEYGVETRRVAYDILDSAADVCLAALSA